jgi:hypothetical protein
MNRIPTQVQVIQATLDELRRILQGVERAIAKPHAVDKLRALRAAAADPAIDKAVSREAREFLRTVKTLRSSWDAIMEPWTDSLEKLLDESRAESNGPSRRRHPVTEVR